MKALDEGSDDCWAMYEEIGREAVRRFLRTDRETLRDIARAWIASDDAHGALVDTERDSPDLGAARARADQADDAMHGAIRKALFGAP
ncbi:hypothetical protein ACV229_38725 [Burkholderia sp. MR1-5-21]